LEVGEEHDIYLLAFNQKNLLADNEEFDEAKFALLGSCKEIRILSLELELKCFAEKNYFLACDRLETIFCLSCSSRVDRQRTGLEKAGYCGS
jgi:hypothetical protein